MTSNYDLAPNLAPKFAVVFAGQSSQSIGMMDGFATNPAVVQTFAEASDILRQDFTALAAVGPAELQNQTVNTQPLMLISGVATWRAWRAAGGATPAFFAGHSLGEYTALVAAGALTFADALPLVRFRAEAMQSAVPEGVGGIAVVMGLDVAQVRAACAQAIAGTPDDVCEAVNLNSPIQTVIAGHRAAVERAIEHAKALGAKRAMLLPMSAPSHCALMRPAADAMANYLQGVLFQAPVVPVIQNADVAIFTDTEKIKDALVQQLFRPVRWIETITMLHALGVATVVECAPGKVLTGLNKRIVGDMQSLAVVDAATLAAAITETQLTQITKAVS